LVVDHRSNHSAHDHLTYPYLIFYEVVGDEVTIHAVRHSARNPRSMPGAG
jgi:hypothetical protein